MADAAVTFLLENLTHLLKYYVELISSEKEELEELKKDLESLKAILRKAEELQNKDGNIRMLEKRIRDAVYDAEDTIDACLTEKSKGGIIGAKNVKLAEKVLSLREKKVKPMVDMAMAIKFSDVLGEGSGKGAEGRQTTGNEIQLIKVDNVVGLEDEEETIINYLNEEKEELDVISIIGMPGLGKTTLAWKIYNKQEIRFEFPVRNWVYVSQNFNLREVFQNILKGFINQDLTSMTDQQLIQRIRGFLEGKKFLLVLDDIWTTQAWDAIKCVLPMNNSMGKVLITSRHTEVGKHASVTRPEPHKLRFLNDDESWELLQLEALGKRNCCPTELQGIGKHISIQCRGLPLSLVVIGGLLKKEYSPTRPIGVIYSEWKKVSENVIAHVRDDKESRASDMVALSHKSLPTHLRDCLLYSGVFPEDCEIPVWTLTRLWIAEGMVPPKEGQTVEETAKECLKDLIDSNLVMVENTKPNGEVKTCRVHDVIRAFCNSRAAVEDQNLFQEIKKYDGVFLPLVSDVENYRRICVHSNLFDFLQEILTEKLKAPRVRSFLCFYRETIYLESKYPSVIPDAFNLLRVLVSKSIKFISFPTKITKLIHLRYITLSVENLEILPDLSSLWNLQTIVVNTNSRILQMKASIWKMIQLRHLKTKAEIILATQEHKESKGGENLQTLSRLSPKNCTLEVFKRARNLKQLGIRGDMTGLLKNGVSFEELHCLETLKLKHDLLRHNSTSEKRLPRLPPRSSFPPKIKRLTLSATFLDWEHMSTLAAISTLEVLKLKDNAFVGTLWDVDAAFPLLQFLLIENTDLESWEDSKDHFPNLWCLVLKNCKNLRSIPLSLAKSLQILKMEHAKNAVPSAKKIEEVKKRMQEQNDQAARGGIKLDIGIGCK